MRLQRSVALAYAAGRDAGTRSMRAGGRSSWSAEDYAVVCAVVNDLWPEPEPGPGETDEPADQAGPVPS